MMMGIGTHLHEYLQNCVLGPMGVLKGYWVRQRFQGPEVVAGYHPDPEKTIWELNEQRKPTWQYQEYQMFDEKYRISGHSDAVLSVERIKWLSDNLKLFRADPSKALKELQSIAPGKECLGEIKTSGAFVFKKVKNYADIPDYYKMQASIYQELLAMPSTLFWYVNRDTCESRVISYPREKMWWNDATSRARIVWEAIRDQRMPDTFNKCLMPQDKRAKNCSFCKQCWDKKFDMAKYVADGKDRADKEGRKLLDLSKVTF
jgi:hypothetical protein